MQVDCCLPTPVADVWAVTVCRCCVWRCCWGSCGLCESLFWHEENQPGANWWGEESETPPQWQVCVPHGHARSGQTLHNKEHRFSPTWHALPICCAYALPLDCMCAPDTCWLSLHYHHHHYTVMVVIIIAIFVILLLFLLLYFVSILLWLLLLPLFV